MREVLGPDFEITVLNSNEASPVSSTESTGYAVLTETIAEIVPPGQDPRALAVALIVLLDGDLFISFFDPSRPRAEERSLGIDTLAGLIPRREGLRSTPAS